MTTRPLLTPKIAPHSEEAEQAVLGSLMLESRCHPEVFALVREPDFYFEKHRLIFAALAGLSAANKPTDFIAVADWLRNRGQLEQSDGIGYLGQLCNDNPGSANGVDYARIVREKAALRGLLNVADQVADMVFKPDGRSLLDVLALAEAGIESIRNQSAMQNTAKAFADHRIDLHAHFEQARKARANGGMLGVPSGIIELDKTIGGFQRQRFYGIAARPGTGKSALLNQIAMHAARSNRRGLIVTAEMTGLELTHRALAAESGRNLYQIINGFDDASEAANNAMDRIGDIPLWIDSDTNTLSGAIAQMALHKARYGIEWAAIDHIGLMETPKFNSRNDQIGFITRSLKKAAKQLDIAVIGLMQLNRGSEGESRRPKLHDLRDSGNIEQDLDVAIFLHTPQEQRGDKVKPLEIGVLKNRSGMSRWLQTPYSFAGGTQRIFEAGADEPEPPPPAFNEPTWSQLA